MPGTECVHLPWCSNKAAPRITWNIRCLESLGHRFVQRLVLVAHRTLGGRSKRGHHKAHQRSTTKIHVVGSIRSNGEALEQTVGEALEQMEPFLVQRLPGVVRVFHWALVRRRHITKKSKISRCLAATPAVFRSQTAGVAAKNRLSSDHRTSGGRHTVVSFLVAEFR